MVEAEDEEAAEDEAVVEEVQLEPKSLLNPIVTPGSLLPVEKRIYLLRLILRLVRLCMGRRGYQLKERRGPRLSIGFGILFGMFSLSCFLYILTPSSKLAAGVLGGVDNIHIKPGSKVLYLGAASGTTVSHVSDVVGSEGLVYAVEFSHRSGRDLMYVYLFISPAFRFYNPRSLPQTPLIQRNMAKKRTNVIPIIEDARHPHKYRMLMGMVDVIFADVAQPDQARIIALNAHHFLKNEGMYSSVMMIFQGVFVVHDYF